MEFISKKSNLEKSGTPLKNGGFQVRNLQTSRAPFVLFVSGSRVPSDPEIEKFQFQASANAKVDVVD